MGLRIWLPLNGNLENKGLDDIVVTNNGATIDNNGKIGKCYSFDGTNDYINITNVNYPNIFAGSFSICFWIYSDTDGSRDIYFGNYGLSGSGNWLNIEKNTSNQLRFWWNDGSPNKYFTSYNILNSEGWTHVTLTRFENTIKVYKNGILIDSYTATLSNNIPTTATTFVIGGDSRHSGDLMLGGRMNDFRLYDEALSPMQIKLISQGLVAHYLLNNNGSGQENLLRNSYRADGNDAQQKYGWEKNDGETPEIVEKDGFQCIHLQTSCTEKKIPSIKSANKILLENGMEYTISCDLMIDKEIKVGNSTPIHYHNGSSSTINEFNFSNVNNGKGFTFKSISPVANTIIPANTWQHYEQHIVTVATPSDSSLPYSTYRAFIYGSVRTVSETATVNIWLKNWKIEKGAISTSWCPNSLDDMSINLGYNNNIEYDVSGYCHNGTKYNITDYTSDTPRYSVATKFNGTNSYINVGRGGMVRDEITVNIWGYMDDWTKYNGRLISCTEGGGWNFEPSSSKIHFAIGTGTTSNTYKNTSGYALADLTSGWHMFTGTYDGFVTKQYVDGVLNTSNNAYTIKTPIFYHASNPILIGTEASSTQNPANYYFNGYMSDVRIYATALSESDIQSLYNNSAFLDSSGNIYATEYTES